MSALFIAHAISSICQSPHHYPVAERGYLPELVSKQDKPDAFSAPRGTTRFKKNGLR